MDKEDFKLSCKISEAFHEIITNLWMGYIKPYNPKDFKSEAKKFIELLNNNNQQDSADFLIQLLELINNELTGNNVRKNEEVKRKKANIQGQKYQSDDSSLVHETIRLKDSIISQNIHGKYSRTMMCENCKEEETSKDDFTVVSLQIPSIKQLTVHVKFYPSEPIDNKVMIDYDFKFNSDQSCISEVENKLNLNNKEGFYYEYYARSEVNKELILINKRIPVNEIGDVEDAELLTTIYMYELSPLNQNCDYYDFKLCTADLEINNQQLQTSVFKISIDQNATLLDFHKVIYRRLIHSKRECNEEYFDKYFQDDVQIIETKYYEIEFDFKQTKNKKLCPIHQTNNEHTCEINTDDSITFKQLMDTQNLKFKKPSFRIVRLKPKLDTLNTLEENKPSKVPLTIQSNFNCSFRSCLHKFVSDEVYPDYICDKCFKTSNCIMNTKISSLPKYLIIHLMRFQTDKSYARSVITKKEEFVDFQINDLDLSSFYSGDSPTSCIYDLYGVIHHSGTIDFGHYYATIRDDLKSDDWFLFNGVDIKLDHQTKQITLPEIWKTKEKLLYYKSR